MSRKILFEQGVVVVVVVVAKSEGAERATLRRALSDEPQTARDLAGLVGIRERDVEAHLAHLQRTLEAQGMVLVIEAAECASCGYRFAERKRLSPPSLCPECHGERIEPPAFRIEAKDDA